MFQIVALYMYKTKTVCFWHSPKTLLGDFEKFIVHYHETTKMTKYFEKLQTFNSDFSVNFIVTDTIA